LQIFLIVSTLVIYIVAAGLLSRGVWYLQAQGWNKIVGGDADEVGSGPGSYDIDQSVWHINVYRSVPSSPFPFYLSRSQANASMRVVRQPRTQRRRRLGNLQRHLWLAELCYIRVCHLVQPILDRGHYWVHGYAV
jgi:hypothetical protein